MLAVSLLLSPQSAFTGSVLILLLAALIFSQMKYRKTAGVLAALTVLLAIGGMIVL